MQIQYELLTARRKGVLITTESPLLDIDSQIELSFLFSSGEVPQGNYYVTIVDSVGREYQFKLQDGKIPLPGDLKRPQVLMIRVDQIEDHKIVKSWKCQNLRFSRLNDLGKLRFEAGPDYEQLAEQVRALEEELNEEKEKAAELQSIAKSQDERIAELEQKLNETITAYNTLAERVEFLENNSNPLEV